MKKYTQLTQEERYQIHALKKAGHNRSEIAKVLDRDKSTIGRELKRNKAGNGYRPKHAHSLACKRRQGKSKPRMSEKVWRWVEQLIREDWSPEQVSGWVEKETSKKISHEWIYLYIYNDKHNGGDLYRHLRCQKPRRKRYGSINRRGMLKERVLIDERPEIVDQRARIGDWEVDTMIGIQGGPVLVTVAERRTRFSVMALSPDRTATSVSQALIGALRPYAAHVLTLTFDNGREFAQHLRICKKLGASGYFAHPYHSWERALNENMNGLIRQYLPRGTCFRSLEKKDIKRIMNKLNNRPRKCLGYKTPNQVFLGINPPVALVS